MLYDHFYFTIGCSLQTNLTKELQDVRPINGELTLCDKLLKGEITGEMNSAKYIYVESHIYDMRK